MPYDLFISYCRRDNQQGRVTELKRQIENDYRDSTGGELHCFFDLDDIKGGDDWRIRILDDLRGSSLLLVVLSPAYTASKYCEWEVVEYLKYEHSRAVQGQGIAPVYFIEVPGLDTPAFSQQSADWVQRIRQRNHVDLRPWHDEGPAALRRLDMRSRMDELQGLLTDRLSRLRRVLSAPGNLPIHNARFVGREVEMDRLHRACGLGPFGRLTAMQGVGGMGKTALALQYAYAYADFYPGGRWMVGCVRQSSLAVALRTLDSALGIQFSDEERVDDIRAATRVLSVLRERAESGAKARVGEKNPPSPRALLLLDNVDNRSLLQPPQTDLLSGHKWLHVIATTRLDPGRIGLDETRHLHLPVDHLTAEDALRLIERCQQQGQFPDEAEREAASQIVRILGGFTLAVEVAAVHLGERKGRLACADLLQRLRRDGADDIARDTLGAVSHVEKLISVTLAPTLETLSLPERRVLATAGLLPPDFVPIPWLRTVLSVTHPEFGKDAEPGYDDPWLTLVNHLIGLRLLQVIEWSSDGSTPRLCRIHRQVQPVVRDHAAGDLPAIKERLRAVIDFRAQFLLDRWLDLENRWEVRPLGAYAEQSLDEGSSNASGIADRAASCMQNLGDYAGAERLFRRGLEERTRVLGREHPDTLSSTHKLGAILRIRGQYAKAETLLRRALETRGRVFGLGHHDTLNSANSLGVLLENKGDYSEAATLFWGVLEAWEHKPGREHPDTLEAVNNLAVSLHMKGDYAAAEPLHRRALEARERVLGREHPDTLNSASNLASLLDSKGDHEAAEPLHRRALEARERVLGPEHPDTLLSMNNLALLLQARGLCDAAEPLFRNVAEVSRRVLGTEHPRTLKSASNLGCLLCKKGEFAAAEPLLRQVLAAIELVQGLEHPDTLTSQSNLAFALDGRGNYAAAESLYRTVLKARERGQGPGHPDTLSSINDLAVTLFHNGEHDEAEQLYRRALEGQVRVLGSRHSDTLLTRSNLDKLLSRKRQ